MKLSEAMREGAKLRPQGFGSHFPGYHKHGEEGCTSCALGAAMEAAGIGPDAWHAWPAGQYTLAETFPHGYDYDIVGRVLDMNDKERKTREEIADWLEGQGL